MENKYPLKIGLFGIGLDAYWPQFKGLKERLEGYTGEVKSRLSSYGAEIIDLGLIDNPEKALDAGHMFRKADVDIIFLYVTTYALSSTVLPVVRRAKVPVVILNLTPEKAIDYGIFNRLNDRTKMTGEWLASVSACPVPEIANVFRRSGIDFFQVTGVLHGDNEVWKEVGEWIEAASVANKMAHNRLGCMGHYYGGMLDVYTDFTRMISSFGGHIEMIEVDELTALRREVTYKEISDRMQLFQKEFEIDRECLKEDLEDSARTSVALEKLVITHDLGSLAYFYSGTGNKGNEDSISSIILANSLLTSRRVPVAGEYEIKNIHAMKIMDCFGAGGSFTEFYALDFNDEVILMGHDGPGHLAIAEGKTRVKPLKEYHGKVGKGLSVEMSVRHGEITLLSVIEMKDGNMGFLVAEGESVAGPILEIGNTNSRYRFPLGIKDFINSWNSYGPAHHCAAGVGHIASKIRKLGNLLGVEVVQVC
ncbi:MAG: arabinose isomerase [Bacteroidota bacterium]|nr:arabinose isomerase [Bacteroidota bacterium]